ncbi:MAG: hypothetical protein KDE19_20875, partial [Caldilineaceae bacterium]|nr:hypothetical protein [Caldilineaceae bacterium]
MNETNTGGGAAVGGDANAGRDIVGRDQNTFITVINQYIAEPRTREDERAQAEKLATQWQNAEPIAAEARYRQSLIEHYDRLRIFGTSSEVPL